MKTIMIIAKGYNCSACLSIKTDAEWLALDVRDVEKMKDFHPQEVYEICIGSDEKINFLRQGCLVDFAYIMS